MENLRSKIGFICDMDGVIYHGNRLLPGVREFVEWTNSDPTGPSERGIIPACRALTAPIELITGVSAYFVGKPNPLMMLTGLRLLGVRSDEAATVGNCMDTDIVAGTKTGLDTALVLSGITSREDRKRFAYRPKYVLGGVGETSPEA